MQQRYISIIRKNKKWETVFRLLFALPFIVNKLLPIISPAEF